MEDGEVREKLIEGFVSLCSINRRYFTVGRVGQHLTGTFPASLSLERIARVNGGGGWGRADAEPNQPPPHCRLPLQYREGYREVVSVGGGW